MPVLTVITEKSGIFPSLPVGSPTFPSATLFPGAGVFPGGWTSGTFPSLSTYPVDIAELTVLSEDTQTLTVLTEV